MTTNYPGNQPAGQEATNSASARIPQYPPPGWSQDQFDRALSDQSHPLAQRGNGRNEIASMGARFGGLIIDWLVVGAASSLISLVLGFGRWGKSTVCDSDGNCRDQFHAGFGNGGTLVWFIVGLVYAALLVGLTGRSLGHRAAGIRVVDFQTNGTIGVPRAAWRSLVLSVTGALLTLGYWSPFFNSLRRGWHDMAGRAIVVKNQ